jgi:hypothetical protein
LKLLKTHLMTFHLLRLELENVHPEDSLETKENGLSEH